MTLGSCRVKKEDSVGAGPQNMFVNLLLMAQTCWLAKACNLLLLLPYRLKPYRLAAKNGWRATSIWGVSSMPLKH